MNFIKRSIAVLVSAFMLVSITACSDQSWSVKANGKSLSMGSYILFQNVAYQEAQRKIMQQDPASAYGLSSQGILDKKLNKKIDDKNVTDWISEETLKKCKRMLMADKKMEELSLSLSDQEQSDAQQQCDEIWKTSSKRYENLGISKESVLQTAFLYPAKEKKISDAIYGQSGTSPITDEDISTYCKDNFVSAKAIEKDLTKNSEASESASSEASAANALPETEGDESAAIQDDSNASSDQSTDTENQSLSDAEIEVIKNKFEGYANEINSGKTTIEKVGESFKADEKLEKDPIDSQTDKMDKLKFSDDVKNVIKELEPGKAKAVKTSENKYQLVYKADINKYIEETKADANKKQTLVDKIIVDKIDTMFDDMIEQNKDSFKVNTWGIKKFPVLEIEKSKSQSK